MIGCPILRAFAKGGIGRICGEEPRAQSSDIPPFAKSAKDGAPDHLWPSKRYSPLLVTQYTSMKICWKPCLISMTF